MGYRTSLRWGKQHREKQHKSNLRETHHEQEPTPKTKRRIKSGRVEQQTRCARDPFRVRADVPPCEKTEFQTYTVLDSSAATRRVMMSLTACLQ